MKDSTVRFITLFVFIMLMFLMFNFGVINTDNMELCLVIGMLGLIYIDMGKRNSNEK